MPFPSTSPAVRTAAKSVPPGLSEGIGGKDVADVVLGMPHMPDVPEMNEVPVILEIPVRPAFPVKPGFAVITGLLIRGEVTVGSVVASRIGESL